MNTLFTQYETAKTDAITFMKNGQISDYFNSLIEMNTYKRLMIAVISN